MALVPVQYLGPTGAVTGTEVRVDGFPGRARTRHVVTAQMSSFTGRMVLEGTLLDEPGDGDWYEIIAMDHDEPGEKTFAHIFDSRTVWIRLWVVEGASGTVDRVRVR